VTATELAVKRTPQVIFCAIRRIIYTRNSLIVLRTPHKICTLYYDRKCILTFPSTAFPQQMNDTIKT